jgi:hypothetical protein
MIVLSNSTCKDLPGLGNLCLNGKSTEIHGAYTHTDLQTLTTIFRRLFPSVSAVSRDATQHLAVLTVA